MSVPTAQQLDNARETAIDLIGLGAQKANAVFIAAALESFCAKNAEALAPQPGETPEDVAERALEAFRVYLCNAAAVKGVA